MTTATVHQAKVPTKPSGRVTMYMKMNFFMNML